MKSKIKNKFQAAHYELVEFCNECKSSGKHTCDQIALECEKLGSKLKELYYEKLYPFHPCRKCLDCSSFQYPTKCDDYWFYNHSRYIASCELTDNVVYFTSDKSPFISGHKLAITREYINSDPRLKKIVDFDVTAHYITEIKSSEYYYNLLETVRQYLEYCNYVEDNQEEKTFFDEFF